MNTPFQTFAYNKDKKLTSVNDVVSGLACHCACPSCGGQLIARKGEIKTWHFAHHQSECANAAESALHLAAKEIVNIHSGLAFPGKDLLTPIDDLATPFGSWVKFETVELEAPVGSLRVDCLGTVESKKYAVEIKVTHQVDFEKAETLKQLNLPTIEIDLSMLHQESWTWESLTDAVLHNHSIRTWIHFPESIEERIEDMEPVEPPSKLANHIFGERIFGTYVNVYKNSWGIVVKADWNPKFKDSIVALARALGGRYQPQYKSWRFPTNPLIRDALLEELTQLSNTDF
jgi:hypothetical protein